MGEIAAVLDTAPGVDVATLLKTVEPPLLAPAVKLTTAIPLPPRTTLVMVGASGTVYMTMGVLLLLALPVPIELVALTVKL